MTTDVTLSASLIFAIVACVGTLINIVNSHKASRDKENEKRLDIEKQFVRINCKLDDISQNLNNVSKRVSATEDEIRKIDKSLVLQNERMNNIWFYPEKEEKTTC